MPHHNVVRSTLVRGSRRHTAPKYVDGHTCGGSDPARPLDPDGGADRARGGARSRVIPRAGSFTRDLKSANILIGANGGTRRSPTSDRGGPEGGGLTLPGIRWARSVLAPEQSSSRADQRHGHLPLGTSSRDLAARPRTGPRRILESPRADAEGELPGPAEGRAAHSLASSRG